MRASGIGARRWSGPNRVRTQRDLESFIATVDDYCRFFRDELGGVFMSLSSLYELLAREQAAAPA